MKNTTLKSFSLALTSENSGNFRAEMHAELKENVAMSVAFNLPERFAEVKNFEEFFSFVTIDGNIRGDAGEFVIYKAECGALQVCHADTYQDFDGPRLASYSVNITETAA